MFVEIKNIKYPAELMSDEEQIKQGMMGRKELNGCMVFKMNKGLHSFWMKNCLIPLDIVFINKNRISTIHNNCQPCDDCEERYKGIGDHVIEFPAGTANDWKIGEKVNLFLSKNPLE